MANVQRKCDTHWELWLQEKGYNNMPADEPDEDEYSEDQRRQDAMEDMHEYFQLHNEEKR